MDPHDIDLHTEHPRLAARRQTVRQERIALALTAQLPMDHLNHDEQEEYLDRLEVLMEQPSAAEEAFFEDRRQRGVGVGMDEAGNIVHQAPTARPDA